MECKFTVGQKVLCIESSKRHMVYQKAASDPQPGDICTIAAVHAFGWEYDGSKSLEPCVSLVEFEPDFWCYGHSLFRPLDDASLDWARKLCKEVPRHIIHVAPGVPPTIISIPGQGVIRWTHQDDFEDWRLR